jgi:hypothetical protein
MKKFLVLFFLFTITVVAFAQDTPVQPPDNQEVTASTVYTDAKDAVSTIHEDGKAVVGTLYQDVKGALQQLAGPLKVGAEHVYTILVKQQVVRATTWLCVDVLLLLLTSTFVYFSFKEIKKNPSSDDSWFALPLLLFTGAFITTLFTINIIVSGFVNPEYGAIQDILDVIRR